MFLAILTKFVLATTLLTSSPISEPKSESSWSITIVYNVDVSFHELEWRDIYYEKLTIVRDAGGFTKYMRLQKWTKGQKRSGGSIIRDQKRMFDVAEKFFQDGDLLTKEGEFNAFKTNDAKPSEIFDPYQRIIPKTFGDEEHRHTEHRFLKSIFFEDTRKIYVPKF